MSDLALFLDSVLHVPSSADTSEGKHLNDSLIVVHTLPAPVFIQKDEDLLEARLKADSVRGAPEADQSIESLDQPDLPDCADDDVIEVASDSDYDIVDDGLSESSDEFSDDDFVPRKKKSLSRPKHEEVNCRTSAKEKLLVSFDLCETLPLKHFTVVAIVFVIVL